VTPDAVQVLVADGAEVAIAHLADGEDDELQLKGSRRGRPAGP
jgi:hypothetical protein